MADGNKYCTRIEKENTKQDAMANNIGNDRTGGAAWLLALNDPPQSETVDTGFVCAFSLQQEARAIGDETNAEGGTARNTRIERQRQQRYR